LAFNISLTPVGEDSSVCSILLKRLRANDLRANQNVGTVLLMSDEQKDAQMNTVYSNIQPGSAVYCSIIPYFFQIDGSDRLDIRLQDWI
jgi:hypothetical protein